MPVRFPLPKPDGTFCVRSSLHLHVPTSDDLASRVSAWADAWVRANETWTFFGEVIHLSTLFAALPNGFDTSTGTLTFVVHGIAAAKPWKDWLLYFIRSLQQAFAEVGEVDEVVNCDLT